MAEKMRSYPSFAKYLAAQEPPKRPIIRALRSFVRTTAPQLEESVKWGNGCWVKGKAFVAYVYAGYPDHVQFGFVMGAKLKDPKGLLQGKARHVRHVRVSKVSDIDPPAYAALLRQAVRLAG